MIHLFTEILHAFLILGLILALGFYFRYSRRDGIALVMAGFALMLFGTVVHITWYLQEPAARVVEESWTLWLLEHFAGYVCGLLLVLFGLRRWLRQVREQEQRQERMLTAITRAQADFISSADARQAFHGLLEDIFVLTGSHCGFVGEVRQDSADSPHLAIHAIDNTAWSEQTRWFYSRCASRGPELRDLNNLVGAILESGEPVISNDPELDSRGRLPAGYPPLQSFLGLPVKGGDAILGVLCIGNRPGGYDQEMADYLRPLASTIAQLLDARRAMQARAGAEADLAAAASHNEAVLNHILDGIITISGLGVVVSFNPSAERIFGYPAQEVIGRNVSMLMPEPHRSRHDDYLRAYQDGGAARVIGIGREVEGRRRDGGLFPMDLAVTEIRRDDRPLYVGIVRDITERRRLERLKGEFLSTVSHELRTPLTSIRGALGLISGGALGALPAEVAQLIGIAHKNSEQLTHLVNDLLDMEKMAAGGMKFELAAQALAPLVEQAVEAARGLAAQYRVSLEWTPGEETGARVRVDAQRFLQVMANLLSNAAKFSPEGGRVEIGVLRVGACVRVAVTDHGPGIPEDFHDRVFEKFTQADAADNRRRGGSGLGLAIAREMVERMQGEIGFVSTLGEGATFFVDLPVCQ